MLLRQLLIVLGGISIFSCGTRDEAVEENQTVLARIGEETITLGQFEHFVAGLPEWTQSRLQGSARVRDYLQSLIDRSLILQQARSQGLEQSQEVKTNMAVALRHRAIQAMEEEILRPRVAISTEDMRREFDANNWGRQLKIAHILLYTRDRAEEALAALEAGRPFDLVAHEFSENRTSAAKGGEKPYFYSRFNAVPAVRTALFGLEKGAISGILPISKGFEIFKVLDERTVSFEQAAPQIHKELSHQRLERESRIYIDSLASQFQWEMIPENMALLMRILRSGKAKAEGEKKVFYLSDADSQAELFRHKNGYITLGEAVSLSQFIRQGRYVYDSLKVALYLERDVKIPELLVMEARAIGFAERPEIKEWLESKKEESLIREMRRRAGAGAAPVSEAEMLANYENNPRTFRTSSMVEVVEIQLESENLANQLRTQIGRDLERARPLVGLLSDLTQKIKSGQSSGEAVKAIRALGEDPMVYKWLGQRLDSELETAKFFAELEGSSDLEDLTQTYIMRQLAAAHTVRHGGREAEGTLHLHHYDVPRYGNLAKEAMEAETGALLGPIEHNSLYSIAKVLKRKETGRRPFEQVKKNIKFTLLRERENEAFVRWLVELRAASKNKVVHVEEAIEKLGQKIQETTQ